MSKMRLVVLAALSVFAFSAVAATAAQAHEYKVEGSPLAGEKPFTVNSTGTFVLKGKPLGVNTTITCTAVKGSGTLKAAGASNAALEFSSCTVTQVKNCGVSEPIPVTVGDQLIGLGEDEFKPESGTTFTEVTLTGTSCSVKGTYKVEGSQVCEISSPGTEAVSHSLSCSETRSSLTLGGRVATFKSTGIPIELTSKEKYSSN
jgi:hypothetical protein